MRIPILSVFFLLIFVQNNIRAQGLNSLKPSILIVQPIVLQDNKGENAASINIPKKLVNKAYEKAEITFRFLEPIYYKNTKAREGKINLDKIVKKAIKQKLIKGQNDIVNMFFVNAVDGNKGPLGRAKMNGNLIFISLGENKFKSYEKYRNMQAFVIAHEIGHNLSLKHAVDDPNVENDIPNIQGEGDFKDRINPKYSLNEYQINKILKSPLIHPRVNFLSKKEGEIAILDESFEPYFSKLQIREISSFINEEVPYKNLNKARAFARKKFQSAVIDFNTKEKEIITFAVNQVLETLIKNNISLMYNHPWRFIKVQSWLCGGFAHTRGTYIILSQKYIDRLTKGWNENMSKNFKSDLILKLGSLLVHEQMHSLQRTFKSKFDKLYLDYWNFERGKVNTEKQIELNQVSNPDAPIPEWLIKNEDNLNTFFWIRTLLNKNPKIPIMGKDFHDKVFIVERYNEDFEVKKDLNNNLFSLKLSDIDFYKNSFPVSRGLDHPNEISAYMFSEFFKAIYLDLEPFQNQPLQTKKNTLSFLNWITVEMK
jgi:hypothetical protein